MLKQFANLTMLLGQFAGTEAALQRCSEDMQQIYRKKPMLRNFNEIAFWHGCSPVNFCCLNVCFCRDLTFQEVWFLCKVSHLTNNRINREKFDLIINSYVVLKWNAYKLLTLILNTSWKGNRGGGGGGGGLVNC